MMSFLSKEHMLHIENRLGNLHAQRNKKILRYKNSPTIVNNADQSRQIIGNAPNDLKISQSDHFIFISNEQSYLTHGLHKYPAKFFPELPKWLIQKYSKFGDTILDPFSGSGTTNVEALVKGRNSIGIDIDPFARFLSKVKTTKLNIRKLKEIRKVVFRLILKYDSKKIEKTDEPDFPYINIWFKAHIISELTYIRSVIYNLDTTKNIKNFYLICFSSIIRKVSNASNECTRTVVRKKQDKNIKPGDALLAFYETIVINILRYEDFHSIFPKEAKASFPANMSATQIKYQENNFDIAITSPPYINAVDYTRTHQLELYWLELSKQPLRELKKKHIGTESVFVSDYCTLHLLGIKKLDKTLRIIFKKDRRRAYIIYKYFIDMEKNLKEVYRVLKPNSRYILVVGNNKIRGEIIPNWEYLIELARKIGFKTETYFSSSITRHFMRFNKKDKIDKEWVLIFKKPSK